MDKSWTVVAAAMLCLVTVSGLQTNYTVNWTISGVQQFDINNSFSVRLGDNIRFNCPTTAFITILRDIRQYTSCNCSAIDESCVDNQVIVKSCLSPFFSPIISITNQGAELFRVFNYFPGETYYLTSFPPNEQSGGPCADGLGMVLRVKDDNADATATDESSTTASTDSSDGPQNITPKTNVPIQIGLGRATASSGSFPAWIGGAIGGGLGVSIGIIVLEMVVALVYLRWRRRKYEAASTVENIYAMDGISPEPTAPAADSLMPKPGDSDFKEDLSITPMPGKPDFKQDFNFSRSFNQYEVMGPMIRGSRSSLTAVGEKSEDVEGDGKTQDGSNAVEKEERISSDNLETEAGDDHEGRVEPNESDNQPQDISQTNENHEEPKEQAQTPKPLRLLSTCSDLITLQTPTDTPKDFPQKDPLSPSISFTGLALERAARDEVKNKTFDHEPISEDDNTPPNMNLQSEEPSKVPPDSANTTLQSSEPKGPKLKKPPKPLPDSANTTLQSPEREGPKVKKPPKPLPDSENTTLQSSETEGPKLKKPPDSVNTILQSSETDESPKHKKPPKPLPVSANTTLQSSETEGPKKPPKPLPVPRKSKTSTNTSPNQSSLDGEEQPQKNGEPGEHSTTTFPHSKPKPKPRTAKQSESGVKCEEMIPGSTQDEVSGEDGTKKTPPATSDLEWVFVN